MRFFGRFLAVLGVLALVGLATGAAYAAGVAASGVAQPAAYGFGWGFVGFGLFHFIGFVLFIFLLVALLRLAFGGRRGWGGRGWGGRGWGGPGHMGGWDRGTGPGPGGWSQSSGDPRETWIRGRLEEWHRTAHGAEPTTGSPAATGPGPTANPPA